MSKDKEDTIKPIIPLACFNKKNILRRWFDKRKEEKEAERYAKKHGYNIIGFKSLIELNKFVFRDGKP